MRYIYGVIVMVCIAVCGHAQDSSKFNLNSVHTLPDTTKKTQVIKRVQVDTSAVKDSIQKPKHDPHKATMHSLMIPGWGQAYNHEYWKIPIVYAAIGIPIGTYFYNNTWYKRTRDAYIIVVNKDTANYKKINAKLIYSDGQPLDAASLQNYRNQFRRDRDYSILITLFAWGLNVVDATVFGHLKNFDVSDDLSMKVQPAYDPVTKVTNLGFVFNFKKRQHKLVDLSR